MTDAHDTVNPIGIEEQESLLAAVKDARRRIERFQKERDERIAVVGMAGRFPGANDIEQFWDLIDAGRIGLREVDDEALAAAHVPSEQADHPDYVRVWGGFDDPAGFDAALFGYSPREAELLDPQQRVFLECAWSALEHAGYDSSRYPGRVGVYAGGALTGYLIHCHGHRTLRESADPVQIAMSNANGLVASRVSYHLDLRGPSCGVQTTCSTSLVAVHTAARSLLAGECDMALAGGVAVGQARPAGYLYQREGINSPDGACRPFDAAAQGTVFGNGVGAIVLKRLSDAQAAGDAVYGVILGSAVNNDGAGKVGLTAPSVNGQAEVLEAALAAARVDPATIDYIEAHGTGTALGDPIEVTALNRAYGPAFQEAGGECALGSVKGNVGHLDAAAGIAGLIKTLLALRHRRLPGTANFTTVNPGCDFAAGPFCVLGSAKEWESTPGRPRRAAVSSFGIGGTNAHVVIEEAPAREQIREPATLASGIKSLQLLPLSARTPEALTHVSEALGRALGDRPALVLPDVAYTLQTGRRAMSERQVCLCRKGIEAATVLAAGEGADLAAGRALPGKANLIFLFSGQGSQHIDMARDLYECEPVFRTSFDACCELLPDGPDIATLLLGSVEGDGAAALNQTEVAQPALFAVEYALAQLWLDRGLLPQAMLGHSIGEYVAACIAGVFTLKEALRVVCARGRLMQSCTPGSMLSVMLSESEVRKDLPSEIEVAAVNGPKSCVLAGPADAVSVMAEQLDRRGIGCRPLETSHAFHTAMMEPVLKDFAAVLREVALKPPTLDIVSNVTGDWLTADQAVDPDYWVRHLRQTVLFGPGLARILKLSYPVLLEVGPGSALTRLARQQLSDGARAVSSLPDAGSGRAAEEYALMALGQLWIAGLDVDWERLHPAGSRRRVGLPTYPFERSSYWIAPAQPGEGEADAPERSDNMPDWFHQPVWQRLPIETEIGKRCDADPESDHENGDQRRWLVLGGVVLADALGEPPAGTDIVWVESGEAYSCADTRYTVDPAQEDNYRNLLADLAEAGWAPDQIINGFGLEADIEAPPHKPGVLFESTMALGRALAAETGRSPLLTLLGRGMQQVNGSEDLDPGAAMALGLVRVLPQDLPGLRCRSIDVAADELTADGPLAGLGDALVRPWEESATMGALRCGFHWQQSFVQSKFSEPAVVSSLPADATYLVSGDLVDGLGPVYASALVKKLGARVVLIGRAGLPAPEEWDRWLASHSAHHSLSQLIRTLRNIGEIGRDYVIFSGDLADPDWVGKSLAEGQAQLGPIQGVFHTAGMGEQYYCPLDQATPESHEALFETKLAGIQVLEQALADSPPAFFLIQSSLSVLVGGTGFAAYAAANSFLDALACVRSDSEGPIWQSINWDVCWTHAGDESHSGGLLADAINPDEVWRATRSVLARSAVVRVAVTPGNLRQRQAAASEPPGASVAESIAPGTAMGRPAGIGAYTAPGDVYESTVARIMGELLGIEKVGASDNFFELGGHSLLAIQVITRLRLEFDVELPMRALLFEAPTVSGIAKVIRDAVETVAAEHEIMAALLDDVEAEPTEATTTTH